MEKRKLCFRVPIGRRFMSFFFFSFRLENIIFYVLKFYIHVFHMQFNIQFT